MGKDITLPLTMKHPIQILIADSSGQHIFASVTNSLLVFRATDGQLIGSWVDPVDAQEFQDRRFKARMEKQSKKEEQNEEPETKKIKRNTKDPKVPVPGPGAPCIYNHIRSLSLSRNEQFLIGTTDSDKATVIFRIDFTQANCLELIKRQTFPKRPCSVLTTPDDKNVVVADKFGDVYEIDATDPAVVAEKDLVPILGHVSMLSEVVVAEHDGKQYILTGDRDEHIKVSHYPKSYVVRNWLFGHHEFVSCLQVCPFDKDILVSGGGDDYLIVWNWWDKKELSRIELRELVAPFLTEAHMPPERFLRDDSQGEICISKVAVYTHNNKRLLLVLCENTSCLLTFSIGENMVVRHSQTLLTDSPIIDFVVVANTVIAAVDVESNTDLLRMFRFDDNGVLSYEQTDLTKTITASVDCNVSSRSEFCPLYYINSLRKRSEH